MLFIVLGLWVPFSSVTPDDREVFVVVVNRDAPVSDLSFLEVRRLFKMERRFWKTGKRVDILLPGSRTRARNFLLEKICGMDESEYKQLILLKLYQGEIDLAPKTIGSDREILLYVSEVDVLAGLVPAEVAKDAPVKVLRVDGKLPGEGGYPLVE